MLLQQTSILIQIPRTIGEEFNFIKSIFNLHMCRGFQPKLFHPRFPVQSMHGFLRKQINFNVDITLEKVFSECNSSIWRLTSCGGDLAIGVRLVVEK